MSRGVFKRTELRPFWLQCLLVCLSIGLFLGIVFSLDGLGRRPDCPCNQNLWLKKHEKPAWFLLVNAIIVHLVYQLIGRNIDSLYRL